MIILEHNQKQNFKSRLSVCIQLLLSQITGLEYLEFCMKAKGLPVSTLTIQHLNEIFQLPLDRYAAEYSTGMKKKLGFMALLLQENDVFILDERSMGWT